MLLFSAIASKKRMVRTRSGQLVSYTALDYGRASREENSRRHQKRKLLARAGDLAAEEDEDDEEDDDDGAAARGIGTSTPRRARKTRGQVRQEEALATPPSAHVRVGVTPPEQTEGRMLLRGSSRRMPTCSDYGTARHFSFKGDGYFFCHACDLWDGIPADLRKRCSRTSTRYACTAEHTSFQHPTTFRKGYCRRGDVIRVTTNDGLHDSEYSDEYDDDEEQIMLSLLDYGSCDSSCTGGTTADEDGNDDDDDRQQEEEGVTDNDADACLNMMQDSLEESGQHGASAAGGAVVTTAATTTFTNAAAVTDPQQISLLKGKIMMLQKRNKNLVLQIARMNSSSSSEESAERDTGQDNAEFILHVREAINTVIGWKRYRRWGKKRVGALLAKLVFDRASCLPHLLSLARKHFRENVFTPFSILREMDLAGGTLSYEGIEVLRRVETKGVKGFRGSMIPSKSEVKRMASVVEWYAREQCPFQVKQTKTGESVLFDCAKALLCVLKAFHLDVVGQSRSLSVAYSIDGASLSKNLSIIAGGIKVIDRGARCPVTGKPLLDNPSTMSAQSRKVNIPLQLQMGRETKETFADFDSMFKFFDSLSDAATMPMELKHLMCFLIMVNCDLSAQWKGLCKGGAAKVYKRPCTGCATESDSLATPNARPCARWCTEHSADPEWKCYHKPMASPENVAAMQAEVELLLSTLERGLEEIDAESRITRFDAELEDPPEACFRDNMSVHYTPDTATQKQSYSRLLSNELMLRGHDINGNLEARRERLRLALKDEATIRRLSKEIDHGSVKEGAYFLLMHTLPCILHMENRNGIKFLSMLLIEGISNARKRLSYQEISGEGTRVLRFIADVEDVINRSILGTNSDPCQWMCPFDIKKKELGPITMDNVRTRRIIDMLDVVVDICVVDASRKASWVQALNHYRIAMVMLRKKEDFTNDEIAAYQFRADKFFQVWLHLFQIEGITNYIHMMGAGHIADYLYKWKNLYRFSQQGWEALNSLIKTFFFRRTSHGGGVRGESKKSRLVPIARWLQRRLIFLCRTDEHVIRQYVADNPMPHGLCTQGLLPDDDVYDS